MGLTQGMSRHWGLEPLAGHNMLCFFLGKTKYFVKITFDKMGITLYNI